MFVVDVVVVACRCCRVLFVVVCSVLCIAVVGAGVGVVSNCVLIVGVDVCCCRALFVVY